LHGQYYTAPQTDVVEGRMQYIREGGRYVETTPRMKAEYHPELTGFFPRMWSSSSRGISGNMNGGDRLGEDR
jgi:hypothetical protein